MKNDFVCFGEILWDILPGGAKPGGAPMNVAYHLKQLGHQPAMITRIGNDDKGDQLKEIMEEKKFNTGYVQTDTKLPTGIVYANPDATGEMHYEIVSPSAWDNILWDKKFESLFNENNYLVYGSLICRAENSRNTLFRLLETAKNKVLDINLRPPFYSQTLITVLLHKCDILKINKSELSLISSWNNNFKLINDQLNYIQDHFKIPRIIVTLGGEGSIMNFEGETFRHYGYDIIVEDTVGSGDAFLAALISSLSKNRKPDESLTYACAIGALVTSKKGAWPEYQLSELENLKEKVAQCQ